MARTTAALSAFGTLNATESPAGDQEGKAARKGWAGWHCNAPAAGRVQAFPTARAAINATAKTTPIVLIAQK